MAIHTSLGSLFTAIANAIRAKKGTTALIVADDFPDEIAGIATGIDVSDTTAAASDVLNPKVFHLADGTLAQGTIPSKSSSDLTASGATVTAPAGYYSTDATKTISSATTGTSNSGTNVSTVTPGTSTQYVNITAGYTTARKWTISPVSNLAAANIVQGKTVGGVTGTGTYYDYYRFAATSGSATRTMKTAWNGSGSSTQYATWTCPSGFRCTSLYFIGRANNRSNGVINFDGSLNGGTRTVYHMVDDTEATFTDSTALGQYCTSWNASGYCNPGATVYIPTNGASKGFVCVAVGYNV